MIKRCAAIPEPAPEELPRDVIRLPGGAGNTTRGEGVRRGVGFAVGFKNLCYSEGFDDFCAARVRLFADGSAEVHCAAAEVGQGVTNVILQVACTELGTDRVRMAPGSTAGVGVLRIRVRLAHDVDGRRRGARRVPCGARGTRAHAATRSTSSASTAIRRRRRSIPRPAR